MNGVKDETRMGPHPVHHGVLNEAGGASPTDKIQEQPKGGEHKPKPMTASPAKRARGRWGFVSNSVCSDDIVDTEPVISETVAATTGLDETVAVFPADGGRNENPADGEMGEHREDVVMQSGDCVDAKPSLDHMMNDKSWLKALQRGINAECERKKAMEGRMITKKDLVELHELNEQASTLLQAAMQEQQAADLEFKRALKTAGVGCCSSINLLESEYVDGCGEVLHTGEWLDIEFEVALDSGSIVHVCRDSDTPGYSIFPSAGSQRGQCFLVGNGGKMPNLGEKRLNLSVDRGGGTGRIASCFQIAQVTRPLMSVGKICDSGFDVNFKKDTARVVDSKGKTVCEFHRNNGGLYLAKMRLTDPNQPFGRQE